MIRLMSTSTGICPPQRRQAVLTERRRLKMACSAHAYVRDSTLKFYEWLDSSVGRSLPQGPPVWICGDCHLGNLGPVADATGHVTAVAMKVKPATYSPTVRVSILCF